MYSIAIALSYLVCTITSYVLVELESIVQRDEKGITSLRWPGIDKTRLASVWNYVSIKEMLLAAVLIDSVSWAYLAIWSRVWSVSFSRMLWT
jgi:hypothetical protein